VVTSDHGEEFWEFRDLERERFEDPRGIAGVGHGHALVPPVLEVPILSDDVDIAETDGYVSTIDIVPSILRELGAAESYGIDGQSLAEESARPILSQEIAYGPNQISVTEGRDHLIVVPHRDELLLMDFETGEVVRDSDRVTHLESHLPSGRTVGTEVALDEETKGRLADLGYR